MEPGVSSFMGGTNMSNNYEAIIKELAEKRTMDKRKQEEAVRKEESALAAAERAVMAPISHALDSLKTLCDRIYLFDRTSDVDFQVRGRIEWEVSARDAYAAFTGKMRVMVYRFCLTGREGVRVALYAKDIYGSEMPDPYEIEIYENASDAIPSIMSKIADMIRHR
jgi:hypothetical protein